MTKEEMIFFLNECAEDLEVDHNLEIWGMEMEEKLQECADAFRAGAKALERESILDKIRAEIEECKQYRGMTGNPVIDKHNVGLDKYYDLGLEKAIKIIDKYKTESEKNR